MMYIIGHLYIILKTLQLSQSTRVWMGQLQLMTAFLFLIINQRNRITTDESAAHCRGRIEPSHGGEFTLYTLAMPSSTEDTRAPSFHDNHLHQR